MSAQTVLNTARACAVNNVFVGLHAMADSEAYGDPSVSITFRVISVTGISDWFHGTTTEVRTFAAELIRHADAADAAHAKAKSGMLPLEEGAAA